MLLVQQPAFPEPLVDLRQMACRDRGVPVMVDVQSEIQVGQKEALPPSKLNQWCRFLDGWMNQVVLVLRNGAPFDNELHDRNEREQPINQKENPGVSQRQRRDQRNKKRRPKPPRR